MASRSGSRRATPAVKPGSRSCKAAVFAPPVSRSDSKSDELGAPEKGISAPSHASASSHVSAPSHATALSHANAPSYVSAFAPMEPILALKYSKVDLMTILKIFSETKGQEPKAEVPRKRSLKAKVPNIYFKKSHMDYYHFCQQYENHFETAGATRSNRTPFATSFFYRKINFW